MKKNNFFLSAAVSAFATLQLAAAPANSIELEWCCKNDTSLPYEIALDRTKLAKLAGIPQNSAIKAVAVTADGEKELDTKIIPGNTEGKELLRFTVPAGTDKLYAKVEKEEKSGFTKLGGKETTWTKPAHKAAKVSLLPSKKKALEIEM